MVELKKMMNGLLEGGIMEILFYSLLHCLSLLFVHLHSVTSDCITMNLLTTNLLFFYLFHLYLL